MDLMIPVQLSVYDILMAVTSIIFLVAQFRQAIYAYEKKKTGLHWAVSIAVPIAFAVRVFCYTGIGFWITAVFTLASCAMYGAMAVMRMRYKA